MSVAKGFRLSDDSTAKLDWNYVTKPDGTKSIIEEVNDVKQDLNTFSPNSKCYVSGKPTAEELLTSRYYYKSTSTTPNSIKNTPNSNNVNGMKLVIDSMPSLILYNVNGLSGLGYVPLILGNGANGEVFVTQISSIAALKAASYTTVVDETHVIIDKTRLQTAEPTATHLFLNYNVAYDGVKTVLYYSDNSISERLNLIESDGWVTPQRASFLQQTKNYYDPSKVVNGYYYSGSGVATEDSRFKYIPVDVPAGKTIFVSGNLNGGGRTLSRVTRFNCVKNAMGTVVASNNSNLTSYVYTNTTNSTVTVYFTLYLNHSDFVVTDYMIQIVDSTDDVVVSDYVPYGYKFTDIIQLDSDLIDELKEIVTIPESFFDSEIEITAETIREKTIKPCLTYNIITDTHLRPSSPDSVRQTYDSIANISALNRVSYADAVVHLGDVVSQAMVATDGATDAEVYATMRKYVKKFNDINRCAYICNGNHDGKIANIYQQYEWYSVAGRLNEDYAVKDPDGTNYFYVDYPRINTRCVFLATPDNIEDAESAVFGYTPRMLNWLVNTALNVPNNYGVIMFAHIAPFFTWYISNGMANKNDFYGICNAFHNHTSYTGTVQNADFSSKTGTKLVAYICGHAHGDSVLTAGETVVGKDVDGNDESTTNGLPCPVINIGCGLMSAYPMSNYNAVAPSRADKTVTQDLWDTMIYRPDLNKIYMIRFGAGNDREISVN